MAFTIKNLSDPTSAVDRSQSGPEQVDFDILVAGQQQTGVRVGCAVSAQSTPDMTVAVGVGSCAVLGAVVAVAAGNVTVTANSTAYPRRDLVVVNTAGVKSVLAGTSAVFPAMPSADSATYAVLAALYVPAGAASIPAGQVMDKRVFIPDPGVAHLAGPETFSGAKEFTVIPTSGGLSLVRTDDSRFLTASSATFASVMKWGNT